MKEGSASGGAHCTIAKCGLRSSAPAVYAVLAPVAELSLQRLRASAPVVEYIAPAPAASWAHCTCSCSGCSTALCWRAARGPHTKTGTVARQDLSQFWGSYCHDTHVKTQCCGSHPAAPLLTDTRRLTVGPGTREDLVAATAPVRRQRLWWYRPWRRSRFGQRLCPHPGGSDDALGQWLPAIQDDPQRSAETQAGVGRRRSA